MMEPYKTNQEVFDKAFAGLKAQGFKHSGLKNDEGGNIECLYTDDVGNHCAVGHLLPKETQEEIKGTATNSGGVLTLFDYSDATFNLFKDIDLFFLEELQLAHDGGNDEADMEARLREFAREYGLSVEGQPPF